MVVRIEEISEKGLCLTDPVGLELLSAALSDERDKGFTAAGPAPAKLTLTKVGTGVLLVGELQLDVVTHCDRCLTQVQRRLPIGFTLNLMPGPHKVADATDADEEIFDGKTIDLDPILREQVLLALPMRVVCREDCKGLCPSCGQDLNLKKCACEPKGIDPRLAVLKDIKLN